MQSMNKRMQCKDIPDRPVLEFLRRLDGKWANWYGAKFENSVTHAMPADTPEKLVLAKMRRLIQRGLVDGCGCGCRGDFVLTEKGAALLAGDGLKSFGKNNEDSTITILGRSPTMVIIDEWPLGCATGPSSLVVEKPRVNDVHWSDGREVKEEGK